MTPILEVEDLSISFLQYDRGTRRRVLPAIRRLDLTLEAGQVTAVSPLRAKISMSWSESQTQW